MMGKDPVELQKEYDRVERKFSDISNWMQHAPAKDVIETLSEIVTVLPFLIDQPSAYKSALEDAETLIKYLKSSIKPSDKKIKQWKKN